MFQITRLGFYVLLAICTRHHWNLFKFELSDFLISVLSIEASLIAYSQNKNNRDQIEIQLFLKFNEKYNELNDRLESISKNGLNSPENKGFTKSDQSIIIDYINLCCEQYYCYRVKKHIPNSIWKFWHAGIMYWCNNIPEILDTWESQINQNNSFYIQNNDHPFKQEASK